MPVRSTIVALFLGLSLALPADAGMAGRESPPKTRLWGIGATAWLCYQAPCGWRSVFPIARDGTRGRPRTYYDQPDPPLMDGRPADLARIRETYARHGCILAEGELISGVLKIRDIVGDC